MPEGQSGPGLWPFGDWRITSLTKMYVLVVALESMWSGLNAAARMTLVEEIVIGPAYSDPFANVGAEPFSV